MKNSSNLISYVFSQSWKTFTQYLFKIYRTFCLGMLAIFVGAILLVSLGAASHSGLNLEEASSWIKLITTGNIILCIVFIVFILWIAYGVYKNFLAIARDEDLGFSSFAFSLRNIFRLFIFSILGLILTAIGFLLFIYADKVFVN